MTKLKVYRTTSAISHSHKRDEERIINQKLEKLYQQIDKCNRCFLGCLDINKPPRLRCKCGRIPVLFIAQNPSTHRDSDRNWVYGGLDLLFHYVAVQKLADEVWITNLVKCSTPNNRGLRREEIKACEKWLKKEIEIIKPKRIIGLGKDACNWLRRNKYNYVGFPHPSFVTRFQRRRMENYVKELLNVIS